MIGRPFSVGCSLFFCCTLRVYCSVWSRAKIKVNVPKSFLVKLHSSLWPWSIVLKSFLTQTGNLFNRRWFLFVFELQRLVKSTSLQFSCDRVLHIPSIQALSALLRLENLFLRTLLFCYRDIPWFFDCNCFSMVLIPGGLWQRCLFSLLTDNTHSNDHIF